MYDVMCLDTFPILHFFQKLELAVDILVDQQGSVLDPVVDRWSRSSRSKIDQVELIEKSSTSRSSRSSRVDFSTSRVDRLVDD